MRERKRGGNGKGLASSRQGRPSGGATLLASGGAGRRARPSWPDRTRRISRHRWRRSAPR